MNDEIKVRERRAREYLTKKEMSRRMSRRWKKESRRELWGEVIGGFLFWLVILAIIWI